MKKPAATTITEFFIGIIVALAMIIGFCIKVMIKGICRVVATTLRRKLALPIATELPTPEIFKNETNLAPAREMKW